MAFQLIQLSLFSPKTALFIIWTSCISDDFYKSQMCFSYFLIQSSLHWNCRWVNWFVFHSNFLKATRSSTTVEPLKQFTSRGNSQDLVKYDISYIMLLIFSADSPNALMPQHESNFPVLHYFICFGFPLFVICFFLFALPDSRFCFIFIFFSAQRNIFSLEEA